MKDARGIVKKFRMSEFPYTLCEAVGEAVLSNGSLNMLGEPRPAILVDYKLKWVNKFREMYLNTAYEEYFMEDGLIEEKLRAIKVFDGGFEHMIRIVIDTLRIIGYNVEYGDGFQELLTPISSAISVLGLMALDCKVSDPYILGSILEQ